MSKKDKITNEEIEEEFGDLMKDLKDYYSTRKAKTENLQKIGIKLNEKIENKKPSILENFKLIYNSSKNFYHILMSFLVFTTVGIAGIFYYYANYNTPSEDDITTFKTQIIPQVALSKSSESEIGVNTDSLFTFASEKPINKQTLEENIQIEPAIDYSVNWKNDKEVEIIPNEKLEIDTEYKVILGVGTQFGEDEPIKDDLIWNFKTRPTFALTGITPIDGSITAPLDTSIEFEFNYNNINLDSFNEHFTIEPEITGHAEIHGKKVVFLPDEQLNPNIDYSITVTEGIENEYGETTLEEFISQFSVSNYTTEGEYISYPNFNLYPEQKIYNAADTPTITVQQVDVTTEIQIVAYKLTKEGLLEYLSKNESPSETELEEHSIYSFVPTDDYNQIVTFEGLEKGLYFVTFYNSETNVTKITVINYSTYGIYNAEGTEEAYIWGFDMENGNTVENGNLEIYEKNKDGTLEQVTNAVFDEQGEAKINENYDVVIAEINEELVILNKNELSYDYYYYSSENVEIGRNEYRTYIYTDRPIYEPGDTVYFKGIVRSEIDMEYSIPKDETVKIVVPGDNGSSSWLGYEMPNLYEKEFELNSFGTFSGEFTIPSNELYGVNIYAYINNQYETSNYIHVTTYSKAQFDVNATLDKSEYLDGDTAILTVNVNRFSGEAYQGTVLVRTCTKELYNSSNYWPDENYLDYYQDNQIEGSCSSDDEIELQLDESGQSVYEFDIDFDHENVNTGKVIVEVEVLGEDEISSLTSTGALVYETDSEVFAKTKETTIGIDEDLIIEFGSFESGTDNLIGGIPFQIQIKRTWYEEIQTGTKYYENLKKTIPVYQTNVRTEIVEDFEAITDEKGYYNYEFTPTATGAYSINITSIDKSSAKKTLSNLFYAIDQISEEQTEQEMQISIDKSSANIGDTVTLTINSSFDEDKDVVLLTYRGNVYDSNVINVKANSKVEIEKTINDNYSPRVYFGIVYTTQAESYYANDPELRTVIQVNTENVVIEDESQKLNIQITSLKEIYAPGEDASFEFLVTDSNGNGVETELSLSAIDKALLSTLRTYGSTDIYTYFHESVHQIISTYNTNEAFWGAGGRGDGGPDRQNFEDTAIWEAHLVTNKNGYAELTTTLPDNLTTWVLDVKGITKDTKVAQTTAEIKVSKDLYVEYNLPEYLRYKDELYLPVRVTNNSGSTVSGKLSLEADGAEILSENEFDVEIENGKTLFRTFQIKTEETDTLKIKASLIQEGTTLDSVTRETEVLALSQINESVTGFIWDEETNEYTLTIDEDVNIDLSSYTLDLSTSILGQKIYTSSSIPATSSIELASLIIKNVTIINHYDEIQPDTEKEVLIKLVEEAIAKLMPNQRYNGGFGWFSYDTDNVETSSYVMLALTIANDAGFEVAETTIRYLENYLLEKLESEETTYQDKSFILYALSGTDAEEVLPIATYLVSQKNKFNTSPSTLAYLSLTLFNQGNTGDGISLITDLESLASETERWAYWEEPESDYNIVKGKTTVTALSYDVLKSYNKELATKAENYLIENSYTLSGQSVDNTTSLYTLIRHNSEDIQIKSGNVNIYVNGSELITQLEIGKYGSTEIKINPLLLQTGENTLRIEFDEGEIDKVFGKLYSSENSNDLNSKSNGITVETKIYELFTGEEKYEFTSGDAVIMETVITSDIDGNYVQVNSLMPAGFEILSYYINSTSYSMLEKFYKNEPFLTQWGDRQTTDQYVFNLYEVKAGQEYKFQIPLIATSTGSFNTSGSSASFVNAPDIGGQSEVRTIVIE